MFNTKLKSRVKELEKTVDFLEKMIKLDGELSHHLLENQKKLTKCVTSLTENLETLQERLSPI